VSSGGFGSFYGTEVDCWAFGCVVAELAAGLPPFHERSSELQLAAIDDRLSQSDGNGVSASDGCARHTRRNCGGGGGGGGGGTTAAVTRPHAGSGCAPHANLQAGPTTAKEAKKIREKLKKRKAKAKKLPNLAKRFSSNCNHLVLSLLTIDPKSRLTSERALAHPWFGKLGAIVAAAPASQPVSAHKLGKLTHCPCHA
jgi:serine/threonine protein kinase